MLGVLGIVVAFSPSLRSPRYVLFKGGFTVVGDEGSSAVVGDERGPPVVGDGLGGRRLCLLETRRWTRAIRELGVEEAREKEDESLESEKREKEREGSPRWVESSKKEEEEESKFEEKEEESLSDDDLRRKVRNAFCLACSERARPSTWQANPLNKIRRSAAARLINGCALDLFTVNFPPRGILVLARKSRDPQVINLWVSPSKAALTVRSIRFFFRGFRRVWTHNSKCLRGRSVPSMSRRRLLA